MDHQIENRVENIISLQESQFVQDSHENNVFHIESKSKQIATNEIHSECIRKCTACGQEINTKYYLSWELMDFCNEFCISKFQGLGSKCFNCSRLIRITTFGKHYLRIKNGFKLFCTKACMEHYKSLGKICCYCQEEISRDFLMETYPFGTGVSKRFFCSQVCYDAFRDITKIISLRVPPFSLCSVCKKESVSIVLRHDGASNFFCTERCLTAYSFVNLEVGTEKCVLCQNHFSRTFRDGQTAFYENVKYTFCCSNCQNIYISLYSKLVSCYWCQNKRYNFGMIRKYQENLAFFSNIDLCSINCLRLLEVSSLNDITKNSKIQNVDAEQYTFDNIPMNTSDIVSIQNEFPELSNVSSTSNFTRINQNFRPSLTFNKQSLFIQSNSRKVDQRNVATMCFIPKAEKSIMTRPTILNKTIQTVVPSSSKILLPVPIPIYVPYPMAMYSIPVPNAVPFPIPIPIPIFIPTTQESVVDITQQTYNKMPNDPFEAELLKIADAIAGEDTQEFFSDIDQNNLSGENEKILNGNMCNSISFTRTETRFQNSRRGLKRRRNSTAETTLGINNDSNVKLVAKISLNYILGIKAWEQWVTKKNKSLGKSGKLFKLNILQMSHEELDQALCLFLKELRKPNDSEYAPDTVLYLCLGIQFYLELNGRVDNIFFDQIYNNFIESLDRVACNFCSLNLNRCHYIITRVEEEHLWDTKQLGCHSPQTLLNTLIFFNTKYYHCGSTQQHMDISFSRILKMWKKKTNSKYLMLRLCSRKTQNETKRGEQHENEDNPLRCPVKIYEFYLSKCPESVRNRHDFFYLQPEKYCVADSPLWYTSSQLPRETLERMTNRIKMVKEIIIALTTNDSFA